MTTVGYIRVSSEEQARSGLSLENQERKIRAYAEAQDLELSEIYNDAAESAKDLKRPAIQKLLSAVDKGEVSNILIYKLDRLVRHTGNLSSLLEVFEKKKVRLLSVVESLDTTSASGRLVVNMIGVIAQWERETISERTQSAMDVKRGRGEKLGRIPPYGFCADGKVLKAVPDEQKVLTAILKAKEEGIGYQRIAESLNQQEVSPRTGKQWYASTIRSIYLRKGRECISSL